MVGDILFVIGLLVSLPIGALYFRDLGDVTQMFLRVKRKNMHRFIRHEYRLIGIGLAGALLMTLAHLLLGGGATWLWIVALALTALLYGFPYVWVHVGLRNQRARARYFPIAEAARWVSPSSSVLVIENKGRARAHPDAQIMRPHLAGNDEGLAGENVVMTYCAMANLGVGYTPEIEGQKVELEVLAQHGNNLILRDNVTGEPIQQIYGRREGESAGMRPWPTVRMTFRGFAKAYPDGEVFINPPSKNPLLRLFDSLIDKVFTAEISRQHREAEPIIDNMTRRDERLHNKTYVWGVSIKGDAVCWTDDFVVEQGSCVNATVGGTPLVIAWDPKYESLGIWTRSSAAPVQSIDFFGLTDQGEQLSRFADLRPGLFWHVWAEFNPLTDINRIDSQPESKAA